MRAQPSKVRLKFVVTKIGSGKTPLGGADAYMSSGVMLLRSQNVHFDGLRLEDVVYIDEETDAAMSNSRVQSEDVLLNITGASIGRCTIAPMDLERANVNQHVCILRPALKQIQPAFLNAVLQSAEIQSSIYAGENGSSREGLTFEQIGNFSIPLPPIAHQDALTAFIERETKRIDGLIVAKEGLLELLNEKQRAFVHHLVSRGLNSRTRLKPSGHAWLGDIPAHWEVKRTKRVLTERDDRSESGDEELLTVSHITGVTKRSAKDVNMFEAESKEGYKRCSPGNLVINTLWAWMGAMGVSPEEGIVSPAYHVYELSDEILPGYVDALARTPAFTKEVTRFSSGVWSSRLRLYPEGLFEVRIPVPPLSEQKEIVAAIEKERARTREFEDALRKSIELLKERRAALITAAVTGRIPLEEMTQ
jgi:type I restriction enzyme S subunit